MLKRLALLAVVVVLVAGLAPRGGVSAQDTKPWCGTDKKPFEKWGMTN